MCLYGFKKKSDSVLAKLKSALWEVGDKRFLPDMDSWIQIGLNTTAPNNDLFPQQLDYCYREVRKIKNVNW